MAISRSEPFIWVTWLAKLMAGDTPCPWETWFQTHNKIEKMQDDGFDLVGWQVDHTRLVSQLVRSISSQGLEPWVNYAARLKSREYGVTVMGKPDCFTIDGDELIVFDCKTGKKRQRDQTQVMIYMHILAQDERFVGLNFSGIVVYNDSRAEIPRLPESFADNFDYFLEYLVDKSPPIAIPGDNCRYCPISPIDCTVRQRHTEFSTDD